MTYYHVPRCEMCGDLIVTARTKASRFCRSCSRKVRREKRREKYHGRDPLAQLERRREVLAYMREHPRAEVGEVATAMACSPEFVRSTTVIYLVDRKG